jgi:hypothetical protein
MSNSVSKGLVGNDSQIKGSHIFVDKKLETNELNINSLAGGFETGELGFEDVKKVEGIINVVETNKKRDKILN